MAELPKLSDSRPSRFENSADAMNGLRHKAVMPSIYDDLLSSSAPESSMFLAPEPEPGTPTLSQGPAPNARDHLADIGAWAFGGDSEHKNANYDFADKASFAPGLGAIVGTGDAKREYDQGNVGQAALLGGLSLIPGLGGKGKAAVNSLETVAKEMEPLMARYKELYGKPYMAPSARPGTPEAEILSGEMQKLEELRNAVSAKEGTLAALPPTSGIPSIAKNTDEEDALARQENLDLLRGHIEAHPNAAVRGDKGRLMSKMAEKDLAKTAVKDLGMKYLPDGPWGQDPRAYQKFLKDAHTELRNREAALVKAPAPKTPSQVQALKAEIAQLKREKLTYEAAMAKLQGIISPKKP
jgi:hypothetical protein